LPALIIRLEVLKRKPMAQSTNSLLLRQMGGRSGSSLL